MKKDVKDKIIEEKQEIIDDLKAQLNEYENKPLSAVVRELRETIKEQSKRYHDLQKRYEGLHKTHKEYVNKKKNDDRLRLNIAKQPLLDEIERLKKQNEENATFRYMYRATVEGIFGKLDDDDLIKVVSIMRKYRQYNDDIRRVQGQDGAEEAHQAAHPS